MEQHKAELRENLRQSTDAAEVFLRELRGLRDRAGLGPGELAARSHYPHSLIAAAEAGPTLPELPVLAAYVRGCGGTEDNVAEWEDRWRSVSGVTASPLLSTRARVAADPETAPAGIPAASPDGVWTSAAADGQDSSVILSALNRFAERMAQPNSEAPPAPSDPPKTATAAPAGTARTAATSPSADPAGLGPAGLGSAGLGSSGLGASGLDAAGLEGTGPVPSGLEGTGLEGTGLEGTGLEGTAGMEGTGAPGRAGRGRRPGWTTVAVIVAAVLVCLLLILLAL